MATIQVRVDNDTKTSVDSLFSSLGLDTSTAVRIFLMASLNSGGIPFQIRQRTAKEDLAEAIEDTRQRRNLHGPFNSAEEAVASMLEE